MDSSTKQYSNSLVFSPEMQHLKDATRPAFIRQLRSRVLTMDHMDRSEPFPFPRPWGVDFSGTVQVSPP